MCLKLARPQDCVSSNLCTDSIYLHKSAKLTQGQVHLAAPHTCSNQSSKKKSAGMMHSSPVACV